MLHWERWITRQKWYYNVPRTGTRKVQITNLVGPSSHKSFEVISMLQALATNFRLHSAGRRASSISWRDFPFVSSIFFFTKANPIKQKVAKNVYTSLGPSSSSNRKNNRPTKKFTAQWTDMQRAMAFALIRLENISDKRRLGTGPAPIAKLRTTLKKAFSALKKIAQDLTSMFTASVVTHPSDFPWLLQ